MRTFRNGEGSNLKHLPGTSLPIAKEKCECGNSKFDYQKVCGQCYLKKLNQCQTKNKQQI